MALLFVALACSLALTSITISVPMIPGDWARLDNFGIYIPQNLGYKWPDYGIQVGFWLLLMLALTGLSLSLRQPANPKHKRSNTALYLGLILICLLGFALRLHTLTALPLIADEIGFAAHASDILHGQHVPIFAPGHNSNPSVYSWLVALSMAAFGQNRFAIRLIPLAFGLLTVPAAYILGRAWWSKRVGLVAAAFLATYPVHVFYSRMSLYDIADPFFAMLSLAFLVRAYPPVSLLKSEPDRPASPSNRCYALLGGMMAGMAQYFYHGSRLLIALLLVYMFLVSLQRLRLKGSGGLRSLAGAGRLGLQFFQKITWVALAFVLVSLPRFIPMLAYGLPFTGNTQSLRLPSDFPQNSLRATLAWVTQPDISLFWLGSTHLLLWPALLAFLAGVGISLWRWRDPRSLVNLTSLVLTTIFCGAILTAAPLYVRYLVALPTLVLLVGLGVEHLFFRANILSQPLPYLGVAAVLVICLYGISVSYWRHPQEALNRIEPGQWQSDTLARQAAELPPGTAAVLLVAPDFSAPSPDPRVMQIVGIAHYIAAYGERRAILVSQTDEAGLTRRETRLPKPYTILRLPG